MVTKAKAPAKKKTTVRTVSAKTAPKKKVVAKKAPARPVSTTKVRRTKSARAAEMQSFKVARDDRPFVSARPNVQTLYWAILAFAVLALGLWVLNMNLQLQELYNQKDRDDLSSSSVQSTEKKTEQTTETAQ